MISESTIEKMAFPILLRQEEINNYVLKIIAKRIREIGTLSQSDLYRLERLLKTGSDVKQINEYLATQTHLQESEIKGLIRDVAKVGYADVKPFYDYRVLPYIPFEKNIPLQRVISTIATQTGKEYTNIAKSNALGFLIRDTKHPGTLKFQSINDTYNSVIDEAIQANAQGIVDYNTVMRRTLQQLVDSGVRKMYWDSGYSQRLDTAVRRNILDGVRAINQGVQDETGKQFGADGKEITVHANSAPDHEPIQGHQFTNEEYDKLQSQKSFTDTYGNKFAPIERAIGTLNCRHFTYSIIVGYAKPNFTLEELEEMKKKNAEGYTTPDGKHMTMYECTQRQRQLETLIRRNKDGQIAAKESGDIDLARKYQTKINLYTKKYKAFSNACGLAPKMTKCRVSGYKKI